MSLVACNALLPSNSGPGGVVPAVPTVFDQNLSPTYGVPTIAPNGRTITHGAGAGPFPNIAYGNNGRNTGRYVFAIRINANMTGFFSNTVYLGLVNPVAGGAYIYFDQSAPSTFGNGPANNVNPVGLAMPTAGRVYMFAVDFPAGKVWVGWDGTFNGIPASGTTPAFLLTSPPLLYPWAQENYAATDLEFLFSSADYPYPVDAGFVTWDP